MDEAGPAHNQIVRSERKTKTEKASAPDKIRAELNIEKWPAIWQPSKSKNKPGVRVLERRFQTGDGDMTVSQLEIGFTQYGTLTTEDQKMFYALIKQWEDKGRPETDVVFFSDRLLSRLLKKKWGTNVIEAITGSLRRLRLTPLTWKRSFHRNDTAKTELEEELPLTLLSDLRIIRRKVDGHVTNQQGYFQFDRNVLSNLLAHFTKPLLIEELFRLQSEIAQLLYVHVDLMLASKTVYERRTKELFDDLGLKGKSYQRPSNRKQALSKAIKELQGVRLSTGVLRSVALEKTHDDKDYKIVFRKTAASLVSDEMETTVPEAARPDALLQGPVEIVVNRYTDASHAMAEAEQLVQYFHERFHSVKGHVAQLKELRQATSLIGPYGLDKAKHVIDYARSAAPVSKYQPQTFGGILQYTSRAVADYEAMIKTKTQPTRPIAKLEPEPSQSRQRDFSRGERRLAALTAEQRDRLFERIQAELFTQYPFLASVKRGRRIQERTIQTRMIEFLQDEPMDLLVIDRDWLPGAPGAQISGPQAAQQAGPDVSQPLAA